MRDAGGQLTGSASTSPVDRARGCLLAGAIGDALGGAVEFDSLASIRARFGANGISSYAPAWGRSGAITDDTQMTLFSADGLIRANVRGRSRGIVHPPTVVAHAYLRWLHTQGVPWQQAGGWFAGEHDQPDGWLVAVPQLHARRAPGNTCLSALRALAAGGDLGSTEQPTNTSKGCGGVMRAAPAGLTGLDARQAFDLGCAVAAITHGHPSGYLAAGVLAATVAGLMQGESLVEALESATLELRRHSKSAPVVDALRAGRRLGSSGRRPTPEELESLGGGWVAKECLAIAVASALAATDVEDGLRLAVNHSGDSDSTGSVCGNLLGASLGASAIPRSWLDHLELADVITQVATDLITEFGPDQPRDEWGGVPDEWWLQYPGW